MTPESGKKVFISYSSPRETEGEGADSMAFDKRVADQICRRLESEGIDGREYPWGNDPPSGDKLNFADKQSWLEESYGWADRNIDDGYAYTAPVGSYKAGASPYGLLDMAGNVYEWCTDWYDGEYYKNSPPQNPEGPSQGVSRVLRGGSWFNDAACFRCACRHAARPPAFRARLLGVRLARRPLYFVTGYPMQIAKQPLQKAK